MHTILADRNCGMNTQAAELLARLSCETVDLPEGYYITTHPYCNCREMGFVLSIRRPHPLNSLNLAFFEHRNSDNLCAIRWEGDRPISWGFTANDIPDSVYPDKWSVTKSWDCGNYDEAIEYVREVFEELRPVEKVAA